MCFFLFLSFLTNLAVEKGTCTEKTAMKNYLGNALTCFKSIHVHRNGFSIEDKRTFGTQASEKLKEVFCIICEVHVDRF